MLRLWKTNSTVQVEVIATYEKHLPATSSSLGQLWSTIYDLRQMNREKHINCFKHAGLCLNSTQELLDHPLASHLHSPRLIKYLIQFLLPATIFSQNPKQY